MSSKKHLVDLAKKHNSESCIKAPTRMSKPALAQALNKKGVSVGVFRERRPAKPRTNKPKRNISPETVEEEPEKPALRKSNRSSRGFNRKQYI